MIDELPRFLAHAVMLESAAVEGYARLAALMRQRGDMALAALFRQLGDFSQLHRDETMRRYQDEVGEALASIDDYHWPDGVPPEQPEVAVPDGGFDARSALQRALVLEQRACDYYVAVAAQTTHPEVQELAQTFAEEEAEHVAALERWIARLPPEA